jgi:hypothetical protein
VQLAVALASSITAGLTNAPSSLTPELTALPLFQRQGISEQGFDLAAVDVYAPLSCHRLSPLVTRKTLLPSVTHFVQAHLDASREGAL